MSFQTNDDPEFNIANGSYKFVEHMGDIAFHVVGNTLPQVYEQTLRAMFSYMCPTARADILAEAAEAAAANPAGCSDKIAAEAQQQHPEVSESMGAPEESAGDNDEGVAPSLKAAAAVGLTVGETIVDEQGRVRRALDVKGNSLESLLFALMNEALYLFHTTKFVPCFSVKVPVLEMSEFRSHTAAIGYVEKRSGVQNFKLRCVMEGGMWNPPARNERGVRGTEIKAITKEGLLIEVCEEDGMWHGHSIVDI